MSDVLTREQMVTKLCKFCHDEYVQIMAHDAALRAQLAEAQATNTRLREVLIGYMSLAEQICYAEPELSQYRALKMQAQQALDTLEAKP